MSGPDRVAISLWSRMRVPVGWNGLADALYGFSGGERRIGIGAAFENEPPLPFDAEPVIVRRHPQVGRLRMYRVRMPLLGTELTMCINAPANDATVRKFARLRDLGCAFAFFPAGIRG